MQQVADLSVVLAMYIILYCLYCILYMYGAYLHVIKNNGPMSPKDAVVCRPSLLGLASSAMLTMRTAVSRPWLAPSVNVRWLCYSNGRIDKS